MQRLSLGQRFTKRTFDLVVALVGLILTGWLVLLTAVGAAISTRSTGFFTQERVGWHGRVFKLYKLRTMRDDQSRWTSVTTSSDARITGFGRLLRASKVDELPQLINVLKGDMSFVGPRPDVPGFADLLEGEERIVLEVRPGITGPASLKYRDEETLLSLQADPESFNRNVLFADKVRINVEYVRNYSFAGDLRYIFLTIAGRSIDRNPTS